MAQQQTGPDVRQLQAQKLPEGEFPGGKNQDFRVCIAPEAHEQIWKHGSEDTTVEICGILVGTWGQDGAGPFVAVLAAIRGEAASNKFAEVTFTHETWAKINAEMDTRHADKSIVGWYHTHPNFGIFLSDRDRFIQENFFSGPGQIALVIDPIQKTEGVFIWRDGKTSLAPSYWVGNRLSAAPVQPSVPGSHAAHTADSTAPAAGTAIGQLLSEFSVSRLVMSALQLFLAFFVGYLCSGYLSGWALNQARQQGMFAALSQFGFRPGLELRAEQLKRELQIAADRAGVLGRDHQQLLKKLSKDAPDKEIEQTLSKSLALWKELNTCLCEAEQLTAIVQAEYCLTPNGRIAWRELERELSRKRDGLAPQLPRDSQKADSIKADAAKTDSAKGESASGKKSESQPIEKSGTAKSVPDPKAKEPAGKTKEPAQSEPVRNQPAAPEQN